MKIEVKATERNNISYETFLEWIDKVAIRTRWNAISFFIGFLGVIDEDMYHYIEKAYQDGFLA